MAPDFFSARKRSRQARAEDTQNVILEAATHIVYSEYATGFSTNRIAEKAGVSIGSLYQYFPGKDAILHALVQREFSRVVDDHVRHIRSLDTTRLSLDDAIGSIVDHVFDSQSRRRPLYQRLAMSVLSIKHLRFTLDNDARVLAAVRETFSVYPDFAVAHIDALLFVALHALKGVQIGAVVANRPNDDRAFRAAMTRAIVAAVAPGRFPASAGAAAPADGSADDATACRADTD